MPSEFGAPLGDSNIEPTRVYPAADVDRYVEELTAQVADLRGRLDEAKASAEEAGKQAGSIHKAEGLLGRALLTAQEAADKIISAAEARARDAAAAAEAAAGAILSQAREQGDQVLADAERRAGALVADADRQSQLMIAQAKSQASAILSDARAEASGLMEGVRRDTERVVNEAHETVEAIFSVVRASEEAARDKEVHAPAEEAVAADHGEDTEAGGQLLAAAASTGSETVPDADLAGAPIVGLRNREDARRLLQVVARPSVIALAASPEAPAESAVPASQAAPSPAEVGAAAGEGSEAEHVEDEPPDAPTSQSGGVAEVSDENDGSIEPAANWPAPSGPPVLPLDEWPDDELAASKPPDERPGPSAPGQDPPASGNGEIPQSVTGAGRPEQAPKVQRRVWSDSGPELPARRSDGTAWAPFDDDDTDVERAVAEATGTETPAARKGPFQRMRRTHLGSVIFSVGFAIVVIMLSVSLTLVAVVVGASANSKPPSSQSPPVVPVSP